MTAPILTRAAFTAWLAQWPDEKIVGHSISVEHCPIARYLQDAIDDDAVFVDSKEYRIGIFGRHCKIRRMPEWASSFVNLIDNGDFDWINAGTAREILARIPDESEAAQ